MNPETINIKELSIEDEDIIEVLYYLAKYIITRDRGELLLKITTSRENKRRTIDIFPTDAVRFSAKLAVTQPKVVI